jgi:Fic/DOC family
MALGDNRISLFSLNDFVRESNQIEGINRDPTTKELDAHATFINKMFPMTADLEAFVAIIAPGHRLRDQYGLDVRVGNYIAPRGCPEIRTSLDTLLARVHEGADMYHPWQAHIDYETLHPFTDGNGRSGRALWLWQMHDAPIGFLHKFYYQMLSNIRRQ